MTYDQNPTDPTHGGKIMSDQIVDLRGYRCPMVAVKAKKAVQAHPPGVLVVVVSDDPKAHKDIQAMCRSAGWALEGTEINREDRSIMFRIRILVC